jgi:hypothetical protein
MVKKRLTLCNCLDHDVHAGAARESRLVTGRYIPGAPAARACDNKCDAWRDHFDQPKKTQERTANRLSARSLLIGAT